MQCTWVNVAGVAERGPSCSLQSILPGIPWQGTLPSAPLTYIIAEHELLIPLMPISGSPPPLLLPPPPSFPPSVRPPPPHLLPPLTMARRPFFTSLVAMSGEFMPAGSKGNELMKPDCKKTGRGQESYTEGA